MKRTKERFAKSHPEDRDGISGCRMFDGEDLCNALMQHMLKGYPSNTPK